MLRLALAFAALGALRASPVPADEHAVAYLASTPRRRTDTCAAWCTRDAHSQSHCGHPECAACDMCATRVECTPTKKDDLSHEACEPWCKAEHAKAHCPVCACRACSYCQQSQSAATTGAIITVPQAVVPAGVACEPTARDDGNAVACKPWCATKHAQAHCPRCDCACASSLQPAPPLPLSSPLLSLSMRTTCIARPSHTGHTACLF
jgi:hypothetical protein